MNTKKIYIGNDHGGFRLKNELVKYLQERGYEVENVGSDSEEIVRYPYFASQGANAVSEGKADRGILSGSTGSGRSIIANK